MSSNTIPVALREATAKLASVSDAARLDAELLMAHALGMERADMLLRQHEIVTPDSFDSHVLRRLKEEPVAYICGFQDFWDLRLLVTPDVLIPRADSETLLESAERYFAERAGPETILDLGTGSGALILAALSLFPEARGVAIDASTAALAVAKANAEKTALARRLELREQSWRDDGWDRSFGQQFDLILCNPPYVESEVDLSPMVLEFEPHAALFAGSEGLDDYRLLLPAIPELLAGNGVAIFEIGAGQAEAVGAIAKEAGLISKLTRDLAGNPRCLTLQCNH